MCQVYGKYAIPGVKVLFIVNLQGFLLLYIYVYIYIWLPVSQAFSLSPQHIYLFLVIYDVRKFISIASNSFILLCRWLILFVHCPPNLSQDYEDNNFSFPESWSFSLGDPSLSRFCILNVSLNLASLSLGLFHLGIYYLFVSKLAKGTVSVDAVLEI